MVWRFGKFTFVISLVFLLLQGFMSHSGTLTFVSHMENPVKLEKGKLIKKVQMLMLPHGFQMDARNILFEFLIFMDAT